MKPLFATSRTAWRRLALCAGLLAAAAAFSQDFSNAKIGGGIGGPLPDGGVVDAKFECTGSPVCQGRYALHITSGGCSNSYDLAGTITWSGIDISKAGTFAGSVRLGGADFNDTPHPDGTCSIRQDTIRDRVEAFTGSWDGTSGLLFIDGVNEDNKTFHLSGSFKADISVPPPPFEMQVDNKIENGAATSNAQIQFRPQDVGTQGSIYVFAMAPITQVHNPIKSQGLHWKFQPTPKDVPVECVLAQLSSTGQLNGVSASTLQAYVTGVLSAQGQAVQILNGVPTVVIGGATFFVGYGPTAASMLNGGVNRSAVTIPGAQTCQPTAPQTGWWWNPLEDGRGFSIEKHGNNLFFASFLYDASGRATWFVSSGPASLEGSLYVGDLLNAHGGQTLGGAYPGFPALGKEGTLTLTFNSATSGTLIWPGGTVPIQRLAFVPDGLALSPMANGIESGWWWNESEAGRGFFMEFQGDWLDVAGYMYDDQGNSIWYLTVAQMTGTSKRSFGGNWWSFANGQTLTGAWKPNTRTSDHVAPVTIEFAGTDTATMTLPNGRAAALKRHRF